MFFNYDKISQKVENGGNQWTSYSDLFMILAFLFLLMYVVASFRTGTVAVASQIAVHDAKQRAEQLEEQLLAYNAVADSYVDSNASQKEREVYEELVGQINLLEEQAKEQKEQAQQQFQAAREKEDTLNRYQQLVKSIAHANLAAQAKLKEKETKLQQQSRQVATLAEDIQSKDKTLQAYSMAVEKQEKLIRRKISSEKSLSSELASVKEESSKRINNLEKRYRYAERSLKKSEEKVEKEKEAKQELMARLVSSEQSFQSQIDQLQEGHASSLDAERKAFEKELAKTKLTAQEKIEKERQYREKVEAQSKQYNEKMERLKGKLNAAQQNADQTRTQLAVLDKELKAASDNVDKMEGELKKAKELASKRQRLAERIKRNFQKAGIKATVDPVTGDVELNFGSEYFDYAQYKLKPGMKQRLKRTFPVYAASLFEDDSIAGNIKDVEIVGFASPTYDGKMVNPRSLKRNDRQAVNYNLDLSYKRARSIFHYIFDIEKMEFNQQKRLLPYVKVTGRSYFTETVVAAKDDGKLGKDEFCRVYDCAGAQKVVIRFNLGD